MRYYAGIGSIETPEHICLEMSEIAGKLKHRNFCLRSGGAKGADSAFAYGAADKAVIYLPWESYNVVTAGERVIVGRSNPEYLRIAQECHPAWDRCSEGARKLHYRNIHIVLGNPEDTACEFIVCWTPGGRDEGGTAVGIRCARMHEIPIYNLALKNWATAPWD